MKIRLAAMIAMVAVVASCAAATPWTQRPIPDASFTIQPPLAASVHELDELEQREQVRDWAVIGTVAHLGATPEQAAAATYELPPARLPYFEKLYAFEYGHGRRAYLGKRVLLFRDRDDPDPQATIGRLADRVRMENGELPPSVEIYVINDLRDQGTIRVDRANDASRDELFSSVYGYVEADVRGADELTAWLGKVDDLTFAKIAEDGHLRLGGRRFPNTRTANISTEEVATLYQAHEELDKPREAARQQIAALPATVRAAAENVIELGKAEDDDAWWNARQEAEAAVADADRDVMLKAIDELSRPAQSPGFSLDPEWVPDPEDPSHPLILARLRAFAEDPCREIGTIAREADALEKEQPDETRRTSRVGRALVVRDYIQSNAGSLAEVCSRVRREIGPRLREILVEVKGAPPTQWSTALASYYQLINDVLGKINRDNADSDAWLMYDVLKFYEADTKAQCARYIGVAGTRVGMTLFYTDLVAKLQEGIDYALSAPVIDVPGFISIPRLDLPAQFHSETQSDLGTRLWFGVRANGVSRMGTGDHAPLVFDHRFTRLYAASHDLAIPGIEAAPSEDARRALGWWDHHYDDMADYDQEYHRLNQISKWSLVTAALADSAHARYLRAFPVGRDLEFLPWYETNRSRLRFSEQLPVVQAKIACRECVPIITSYAYSSAGIRQSMTGGVSTAARDAPAKVPTLAPEAPLGERRADSNDLGAGKAGTATQVVPKRTGSEVTFKTGRTDNTTPAENIQYKPGATPRSIEIDAGSVGKLKIERGPTGEVRQEWIDEDEPAQITLAPTPDDQKSKTAPKTTADYARDAIAEAAHRRPEAFLAKIKQLEGRGKQLNPELREEVEYAVAAIGTQASQDLVNDTLDTTQPAKAANRELTAFRGKLIVVEKLTREAQPARTAAKPKIEPTELKNAEVYIDEQFRSTREGNLPQLGNNDVARLTNRPDVSVEVLDRSEIGSVDRIVDPAKRTTYERIDADRETWGEIPSKVVLIRRNLAPANHNAAPADRAAAFLWANAPPANSQAPAKDAPAKNAPAQLSSTTHTPAPGTSEPSRRAAGCAR